MPMLLDGLMPEFDAIPGRDEVGCERAELPPARIPRQFVAIDGALRRDWC